MGTPRTIIVRTGFSRKEDAETLAEHLEREGQHPVNIEIGYAPGGYTVEVECSADTVADLAETMEAF